MCNHSDEIATFLREYRDDLMNQRQTWWTYSAALLVVWGVVLLLTKLVKGGANVRTVALVGSGFFLGWLSATIKHFLLANNASASRG